MQKRRSKVIDLMSAGRCGEGVERGTQHSEGLGRDWESMRGALGYQSLAERALSWDSPNHRTGHWRVW